MIEAVFGFVAWLVFFIAVILWNGVPYAILYEDENDEDEE